MVAESPLPARDQRGDLGDRPVDQIGLQPGGDAAHMRQVSNAGEHAAAEVQAVKMGLHRSMGERDARDERAQQGALAALRPADDARVPADAGQVGHQQVANLVERPVNDTDRHHQAAAAGPVHRCQPDARDRLERGHDLIERRRRHSGGSHTWWAAGPLPAIRSIIISSRRPPSPPASSPAGFGVVVAHRLIRVDGGRCAAREVVGHEGDDQFPTASMRWRLEVTARYGPDT